MKLRTSSLKIGRVIHNELKDIIRTFPIIADKNATYPFGIYKRLSLTSDNTKDIFNYEEEANVEIIIATTTYDESVELAQAIKIRMESTKGSFETPKEEAIYIDNIELTNASEDWQNDAYIQRLSFNITMLKECC